MFARLWRQASTTAKVSARRLSILRRSAVTGNWVVFASGRQDRPRQTKSGHGKQRTSTQPPHVEDCPFCRGNEHRTGPSLLEFPQPIGAGWRLRVVSNAYPAVVPPEKVFADGGGHATEDFDRSLSLVASDVANIEVPAIGRHEVVIESPEHNACTALQPLSAVSDILQAWKLRGEALSSEDPGLQHILYFKNNGAVAGASLLHPHSQIVGLPILSQDVITRHGMHLDFFKSRGVSVFQQVLDEEFKARNGGQEHRIIDENAQFVALVPFAAVSPYNIWIVPRHNRAHFEMSSGDELEACAELLSRSLRRLHSLLDEPDWNLVLRSAPLPGRYRQRAFNASAYTRWYISITPRLGAGAMAGFELGSGMFSNGNLPETDARQLRDCTILPCAE